MSYAARDLAGLCLDVTDLDLQLGAGDLVVSGPGLALCGTLLRRDPFLEDLSGPGVEVLAATR